MRCKRRKCAVEMKARKSEKEKIQERKKCMCVREKIMKNILWISNASTSEGETEILSSQIIIHTDKKKSNEKTVYSVAIWPSYCSICDFI